MAEGEPSEVEVESWGVSEEYEEIIWLEGVSSVPKEGLTWEEGDSSSVGVSPSETGVLGVSFKPCEVSEVGFSVKGESVCDVPGLESSRERVFSEGRDS